MHAFGVQRSKPLLGAPGEEDTQVGVGIGTGLAGVPGQVRGDSAPQDVVTFEWDRDQDCLGLCPSRIAGTEVTVSVPASAATQLPTVSPATSSSSANGSVKKRGTVSVIARELARRSAHRHRAGVS